MIQDNLADPRFGVVYRETVSLTCKVYVCIGGSSKRYHKSEMCKGLDNCQANIKKVTLSYAEDTLKRTPCKICYKIK